MKSGLILINLIFWGGMTVAYFMHGRPAVIGWGVGTIVGVLGLYGLWAVSEYMKSVAAESTGFRDLMLLMIGGMMLPIMFLLYFMIKAGPWPTTQSFSGAITAVYLVAVVWMDVVSKSK